MALYTPKARTDRSLANGRWTPDDHNYNTALTGQHAGWHKVTVPTIPTKKDAK